MSQPNKTQVHIDGPLTNISLAYMQNPAHFVAGRVFPNVDVSKQSDKYFTFPLESFIRDQMRKRGDSEESVGSGYVVSQDSYYCDVWALHKDIGDQVRANSDAPLNPDRNAAQFLAHASLLRKEKEFVDTYFTSTAVWGSAGASTNWADAASDPIVEVDLARATILGRTGFMPNKLVVGYDVYHRLKNHPDIVERVKYTSGASLDEQSIARLLGVDELVVCKAIVDSNVEGKPSGSVGFIAGKNALLCYSNPAPALEMPSAGYTFSWSGLNGIPTRMGTQVTRHRIDLKKTDRIEIECAFDMKLTGAPLGVFWQGVVP